MGDVVRMRVKGMTCVHCETSVAAALEDAGARDVNVDHRSAEAVFTAASPTDLAPYEEAIARAGYRAGSAEVGDSEVSPRRVEARPRTIEPEGWLGMLALAALPILCCGLPLLAVALVATGAGAWLAAHGSLLAIPAVVVAAALLVSRQRRRPS